MTGTLKDQTVLVVGRGGGIARAVTLAARNAGAQVIAAGQTVVPHGADRDLTTGEVAPGRTS